MKPVAKGNGQARSDEETGRSTELECVVEAPCVAERDRTRECEEATGSPGDDLHRPRPERGDLESKRGCPEAVHRGPCTRTDSQHGVTREREGVRVGVVGHHGDGDDVADISNTDGSQADHRTLEADSRQEELPAGHGAEWAPGVKRHASPKRQAVIPLGVRWRIW